MSVGRQNPRVSINQLAVYLTGSPTQRRRVIRDAKNPSTFIVNWYDWARQKIVQFINGGMVDESVLLLEIERLYDLTATSDYEDSRNKTNAAALESVLGSYDQLDLSGLSTAIAPNEQPRLTIGGVEISVRPEIQLSGQVRGRDVVGGIKLFFSKTDPLTETAAQYVACLVAKQASDFYATGATTARNDACLVFDIFAGQVYTAPNSITRRSQEIDAACQEISLIWPTA